MERDRDDDDAATDGDGPAIKSDNAPGCDQHGGGREYAPRDDVADSLPPDAALPRLRCGDPGAPRVRHGLPEGVRVYAVGDIHGEAGMLDALLEMIDDDLAERPALGAVVEVFLGDYVDRGRDVAGVIERLRVPPAGRTRVCLLGNHEDAMLAALDDPQRIEEWLAYGAEATLRGYGIDVGRYRHDPRALLPLLHAVLPPQHRLFLEGLKLTHRIGDVMFVHAGIRPGVALEAQEREDLIWIRDEFFDHRGPLPVHVVHGHTPTKRPEATPDRTNIDTGAVYGGALTAVAIEGRERRFLSVTR